MNAPSAGRLKTYELVNGVEVSTAAWDCDILSVMAEQIALYNAWTDVPVSAHYRLARRGLRRLDDLLRDDLAHYAGRVSEVADLAPTIDIVQYESREPTASILLDDAGRHRPIIGVSMNFIKYAQLYLSKFTTLGQPTRTSNLHADHEALALSEAWSDENIFVSILQDAIDYADLDYDERLARFRFLHEPYDFCELNIAIRRFALLHEVAHLHIRQHPDRFSLRHPGHEEFLADELAYTWLMRPFLAKAELGETDTYELAMHAQAPMFLFLAQFMPFAIHRWRRDKEAVLLHRQQDHYPPHPLRREMNLVGCLWDAPMFERMPLLIDCLVGYLQRDVLAYDHHVFMNHRFGPFFELVLAQDRPDQGDALRLLSDAVADAYHLFDELDEAIARSQDHSLRWLLGRYIDRQSPSDVAAHNDLVRACAQLHARRMGHLRDRTMPPELLALHRQRFGQRPRRAFDLQSALAMETAK